MPPRFTRWPRRIKKIADGSSHASRKPRRAARPAAHGDSVLAREKRERARKRRARQARDYEIWNEALSFAFGATCNPVPLPLPSIDEIRRRIIGLAKSLK